jgi:hypothetical protein
MVSLHHHLALLLLSFVFSISPLPPQNSFVEGRYPTIASPQDFQRVELVGSETKVATHTTHIFVWSFSSKITASRIVIFVCLLEKTKPHSCDEIQTSWKREDTLALLEAVAIYKNDWDAVAARVPSKKTAGRGEFVSLIVFESDI